MNWNADDDGDGVTRLGEYAFGGQPRIADSGSLQIDPEIVSGHLQIAFRRRIAGTHELIYSVQGSANLSAWAALSGSEISVTPSAAKPGFEDVVFRASAAVATSSPLFVRVRAQLP